MCPYIHSLKRKGFTGRMINVMRKAGLIIYSVWLWTFFLVSSIIMFTIGCVVWILTRWFDRRLVILHLFASVWASLYIWFNPLWQVRVEGRKKLPWKKSAILISNHQSMADILVLYLLFVPYKWVSKKENFSIPLIGWLMRLNKYIELDRASRESQVRLMRRAAEYLGKNSSLLMFPEGTRHPGGKLGTFKEGAFRMALDNQVDIIPIVLDGTARALPRKGAILTGFSKIRVRVMDPVPYEEFSGKSPKETLELIRGMMEEEFRRLQHNA